jgi:hypothetical protein
MVLALAIVTMSLAVPSTVAAGPIPITLTGYNQDVVTDANPATRFATNFDSPIGFNGSAWFEAGTNGHADGLPSGQTFTSATGSGAVFQLQPANGNNILRVGGGAPSLGTLSLVNPGAFNSLAILASSGGAFALSKGPVTLNFADGTTATFSYNAFDWNQNTPGASPFVALGGLARNFNVGPNGTSFVYDNVVPFALYETTIDLAALGLNNKTLDSLTFGPAAVPNGSGIFAVSGDPAAVQAAIPEPATLALFGLGVVGVAGHRWRRSRHKV